MSFYFTHRQFKSWMAEEWFPSQFDLGVNDQIRQRLKVCSLVGAAPLCWGISVQFSLMYLLRLPSVLLHSSSPFLTYFIHLPLSSLICIPFFSFHLKDLTNNVLQFPFLKLYIYVYVVCHNTNLSVCFLLFFWSFFSCLFGLQ